jgi:hypothetical protein
MSAPFYQTGAFNVKAKMAKMRFADSEKEGQENVRRLTRMRGMKGMRCGKEQSSVMGKLKLWGGIPKN